MYYVTYSLALALDYVRNCEPIIEEFLYLAPYIDRKNFKYYIEMIKNTYKYVFKSGSVYRLEKQLLSIKNISSHT